MISKQFLQGFFDADGSIEIYLKPKKTNKTLSCNILFSMTQSKANSHILTVIKKTYGGNLIYRKRKSGTNEVVYKAYWTSLAGQTIKKSLASNLPLNPSKRHDFLIACKIDSLLKGGFNRTKKEQHYIVHLIYQMSNQQNVLSTSVKRKPIENWYDFISAKKSDKDLAIKTANAFLQQNIQANVQQLVDNLPNMHLNTDYMIGVHCGDGSLMVVLSWQPDKPFVTRPVWAITSNYKIYLQAFQNTLQQGRIKTVGPVKNRCFQYVLENTTPCVEKILPLFENVWLPEYKQQQFNKFKKACCMLKCNYLNNAKDIENFLNCVYDMSTNTKRLYTKTT